MTRRLVLETRQSLGGASEATYQLFETPGTFVEAYIDGVQGLSVVGPIVKLNCFSRGMRPPAQAGEVEERDVVCRLVMGTDTFFAFAEWIRSVEADLKGKLAVPPQTNA
jgi:hypothetical protein